MDAFSYLSVLIAIILGLAITQILKGFRSLLHAREHVRMYWPSLVWAVLVLIIAVQSWWAMFGLREYRDWTFLAFSVLLLQTALTYMLAALVLPDFNAHRSVDLRKSSATFGKYTAVELNAVKSEMLWIPVGFGHGFLVLSET
ncbi:MAG: dTDP-4-dehydrorhamnose 3,5-epimerase family protein, partial [Gammaproteobacteria bacterium]